MECLKEEWLKTIICVELHFLFSYKSTLAKYIIGIWIRVSVSNSLIDVLLISKSPAYNIIKIKGNTIMKKAVAGFKLPDHWGQKLTLHFMYKLHGYVFLKASKQAGRNDLIVPSLTAQCLLELIEGQCNLKKFSKTNWSWTFWLYRVWSPVLETK